MSTLLTEDFRQFCKRFGVNIRIDTHALNAPMLSWIAKRGFRFCGMIHVADGSPRHAFQLTIDQKTPK